MIEATAQPTTTINILLMLTRLKYVAPKKNLVSTALPRLSEQAKAATRRRRRVRSRAKDVYALSECHKTSTPFISGRRSK